MTPIPIRISPFFWVSAALIGALMSNFNWVGALIWVGIIFISILIHEYGHALTAAFFGQFPRIELVAFGGLTTSDGPRLPSGKEFLVVLGGPVCSFLLYVGGALLANSGWIANAQLLALVSAFSTINLFWTVVNLIPILPLDGGQLLRVALEAAMGIKGLKLSMMLSMILSFVISGISFFLGWFLPGALFFLFAFQNLQTWKLARPIAEVDRDQTMHEELLAAEETILQGDHDKAIDLLEKIRAKTKEGILFIMATQHVARLYYDQKEKEKTYQVLLSIREDLSEDFSLLMHDVAFESGDYTLVVSLANDCFQKLPSPEIAKRTALANAALQKEEETLGWLEAALRSGVKDSRALVQDKRFDFIRNKAKFQSLLTEYSLS